MDCGYKTLQYERVGYVARVTLNRPAKLNSINREMLAELLEVAHSLARDPLVRAVFLRGTGRAFCAGADLTSIEEFSAEGRVDSTAVRTALENCFNPAIRAWCELQLPVVVAVNGIAAGAGMSLALAGDVVLAGSSASFIQVFAAKLGLVPDMGSTYFLPRLIGLARVKTMMFLGEPISAADAAGWGLIHAVYPDDELDTRALALAERLASGPTRAFSHIKHLLDLASHQDFGGQLASECEAQQELADSADFLQALEAFKEKRKPQFSGR